MMLPLQLLLINSAIFRGKHQSSYPDQPAIRYLKIIAIFAQHISYARTEPTVGVLFSFKIPRFHGKE